MSWHAAQVGFVIASVVMTAAVLLVSAYVISSVTWSDRWARRPRQH